MKFIRGDIITNGLACYEVVDVHGNSYILRLLNSDDLHCDLIDRVDAVFKLIDFGDKQ